MSLGCRCATSSFKASCADFKPLCFPAQTWNDSLQVDMLAHRPTFLVLQCAAQLPRLLQYCTLERNAFYPYYRYILLCYMNILACLQAIRLTPLQVEQVLIWREEHLRNMLAVYEQRQQLNVEVTLCQNISPM